MLRVFPGFVGGPGAVGLLVLRLVAGSALALHGWPKIQNAFHWMDGMPEPAPGILQALAAVAEFGGGIALVLGLLTPLFCLGIASTMCVAIAKVHWPHGDPFVGKGGPSMEPAASYMAIAIMFLLVGPGILSVDALLFRKAQPPA